MSLATHAAPGQLAGYLFQPERAVYWLARAPAGAVIGVETEDDVVVRLQSGAGIHEQQKHSIQPDHAPFGDRSKDLWNTLNLWLEGIRDGEITLASTEFFLTTNKVLRDGIVKRLGTGAATPGQCVADLRAAGTDPPESIAPLVA